ncbi:hypothetical protein JHK87_050622 [Glycine soja]|nr:hypothetical protein JHK87_050622 [Glycine soja]
MEKKVSLEVKPEEGDRGKWVLDSSVEYKGRVPLRASIGSWKDVFFIIGNRQCSCEVPSLYEKWDTSC